MNLIDYNKAIEALEKERKFLNNREQYGAEHVLIKHALNVIEELPIIRQPEIVRCKDCRKGAYIVEDRMLPYIRCYGQEHDLDWFCADGERK